MSGRNPARRAVVRWALRMFRREWRQQLLVLTLLTVAVTAAVAGSTIAVNAASNASGEYGDANVLIVLGGSDSSIAASGIVDARERYGVVDVIAHTRVAVPASLDQLDVRDQDPNGPYGKPTLQLLQGRFPTAIGEVALTGDAAQSFDATIGDEITFGNRTSTVVGIVENPLTLNDDFALVAPGTLTSPSWYTLLVLDGDGMGPQPAALPGQIEFRQSNDGRNEQAVTALVFAAITLAMSLAGLTSAAGFVVVAQRRQRQLALLAAIGATDRQVRLVMIANGAIVGVVAAIAGVALGIGGWILSASAVEQAANHRLDRFALPWTLIVSVAVLTLVIATIAAWWPARTAARLPVVAALSGRPSRPTPVHRSVLLSILLVAGGTTGIAMAGVSTQDVNPVLLIGGILAVVLGSVFAAPAATRTLGSVARRLPFAPRLALRDLSRYQSRAAAALAAITLAISIAVGTIVIASATQARSDEGNLSDHELLIQVGDPRTSTDPDLSPTELAALDARAAQVVAALGVGARAAPLDVAFDPSMNGGNGPAEPIPLAAVPDAHSLEFLGYPYVATPEVLALYGLDRSAIDNGTDLLTSRDDQLALLAGSRRADVGTPASATQRVDLPTFSSAPNTLITTHAIERNGWRTARAAWIVESTDALTPAQLDAAQRSAAATGLAIQTRNDHDGLASLRTGATLVGTLLALAIIAMAVGLIRGEAARDTRTLAATGAGSRTRRAVTASTAAALAVPGVALGVVGAYVALIASYRSHLDRLVPVPISQLLVLTMGLPLAATLAGWLLAGREPTATARQTLD